ncbi:MAG: hypothetical protein JNL10_07325 [Verrucomicrobiales bacterium]|nr:hypothetical protein [Verrucomicrobiales bacterium]
MPLPFLMIAAPARASRSGKGPVVRSGGLWRCVLGGVIGAWLALVGGLAGVLELDGYGSYAELPEGLGAELKEFTLEFRARWDHLGYYDSPLHFGDTTNAVAFNHQEEGLRTPVVFVQPGNLAPVKAVGGSVLEEGRWIHLAATVGAGGLRLYANGVCVATNATSLPVGILRRSPIRWLGRSPWTDNGYFRGALDDVCLWNRALSEDELQHRCVSPVTGSEEGLVASWTFEDPLEANQDRLVWSQGTNRWAAKLWANARVAAGQPLGTEPFLKPVRILGIAHSDSGAVDAGSVRLWNGNTLLQETGIMAGGVFRLDVITDVRWLDLEIGQGGLGAWQRIAVSPGAIQAVSVALQPCRSVFGRVTTLNGVPQAGVELMAFRAGGRDGQNVNERVAGTSRTDSSGRFEFLNLPEGNYRIVCAAFSDALLVAPARDPEVACVVTTGRPVEVPDFRIPRLHRSDLWRPFGREDGLPEQGVNALAADSSGNVWFGTSGGLSRYDGISVTTWRRKEGLPSDFVMSLAVDSKQELWIGTSHGLACLRDGRVVPAPGPVSPSWPIESLAVASDRSVWAGTPAGLFRWDGKRWSQFGPEDGLPSSLVRRLKVLQDGTLVAWTDGGLVRWKAGRFELWPRREAFPGLPAADSWVDPAGRPTEFLPFEWRRNPMGETWAMGPDRLWRHDGNRWRVSSLTEGGVSFGYASAMAMDSRGTVWVGNQGKGALRRVDDRVRQLDEADGLPGRAVKTTERTPDGSLWIGTDGGIARWREGLLQTWTPHDGLPARRIRSLKGDRTGRLWVGTDSGVLWFDGQRFVPAPGAPQVSIPRISEGTDGTLWLATSGAGIFRWTLREGFQRFGVDRGIWEGHLTSIHSARNGALWYSQDGYVAQVTSERIFHTMLAPSAEGGGGAPGFRIVTTEEVGPIDVRLRTVPSALAEGADGTVWVGTYGYGLLRFRGGRWTHFPAGVGLPSGRIQAVHVAGDGRLWCGTPVGACVFDGELWSVLDTRDGLSGNEVSSIQSDADGTLWFGTDEGLTRYMPARRPLTAVLAAVEDGAEWTGGGSVLATTGERLTFTVGTERVNRVRWRVTSPDGRKGVWSDPAPAPSLVWRPESPGEYVIEAMAVDRDLNRSPVVRLEVEARHPWFRDPWFMVPLWTCGLGMVIALGSLGIRNRRIRGETERLRKEAAERAEQERLRGQFARELINTQEAERRRLAGELHDSLGQELLLIRNTALLAARNAPEGPAEGPLAEIADRASRTIQEVRSIAYALRPQELDRLGLIRALRTLCEEMTEAAGLELAFESDPIRSPLAPDAEIALYRAVQEALSNVVRHARARRVEFGILELGGQVIARLRDDGVGFSPARRPTGRSGLGLVGMNERMRLVGGTCSISSVPASGTEIEFRIPLRSSEPGSNSPPSFSQDSVA